MNILHTTSNILARRGQRWPEADAVGIPVPGPVFKHTDLGSFLCPLGSPIFQGSEHIPKTEMVGAENEPVFHQIGQSGN